MKKVWGSMVFLFLFILCVGVSYAKEGGGYDGGKTFETRAQAIEARNENVGGIYDSIAGGTYKTSEGVIKARKGNDGDPTFWSEDIKKEMENLKKKSESFPVSSVLQVENGKEGSLELSAKDEDQNIIYKVMKLLITTIGTLAVFLYVLAGFFIITSRGDENQLQKGKTIVIYTSLGLAVAFGSYVIVYSVISITFNI